MHVKFVNILRGLFKKDFGTERIRIRTYRTQVEHSCIAIHVLYSIYLKPKECPPTYTGVVRGGGGGEKWLIF